MTNRLTLDYGMRFVHQTPQYDQFDQASNFFPNQFSTADSQVLYTAGCSQRRSDVFGQHPRRHESAHRAGHHGGGPRTRRC